MFVFNQQFEMLQEGFVFKENVSSCMLECQVDIYVNGQLFEIKHNIKTKRRSLSVDGMAVKKSRFSFRKGGASADESKSKSFKTGSGKVYG